MVLRTIINFRLGFLISLLLFSIFLNGCSESNNVDKLLNDLNNTDGQIRCDAARALGQTGTVQSVYPLMSALHDENPRIQWESAYALGRLGKAAVFPLIEALKDEDPDVQWNAAWALGKIGRPAVVPLINALKDKNPAVRGKAAFSLGKIGKWNLTAVSPLISGLRGENLEIKKYVARALGNIGKPAIKPLVECLTDWSINPCASLALSFINWEITTDEDKIHYLIGQRRGEKLRRKWEITKKVLLNDIKSPDYPTVENALFAFIGIGNESILPELIAILKINGNPTMAKAYINCSYPDLEKAGREWAEQHGHRIEKSSAACLVEWGFL